jgi:hypothetical protein
MKTIKDITVKTVEIEDLVKYLNIPMEDNCELVIDSFCIYEDRFEINKDCCFSMLNDSHHNNEIQKVIDIACRIKKYDGNGSFKIRMDKPDFVKTISLKEYVSMAKDVKLTDFIRYNYNPRITQNQGLLMKYINLKE